MNNRLYYSEPQLFEIIGVAVTSEGGKVTCLGFWGFSEERLVNAVEWALRKAFFHVCSMLGDLSSPSGQFLRTWKELWPTRCNVHRRFKQVWSNFGALVPSEWPEEAVEGWISLSTIVVVVAAVGSLLNSCDWQLPPRRKQALLFGGC